MEKNLRKKWKKIEIKFWKFFFEKNILEKNVGKTNFGKKVLEFFFFNF